jgi:hypothetical protein
MAVGADKGMSGWSQPDVLRYRPTPPLTTEMQLRWAVLLTLSIVFLFADQNLLAPNLTVRPALEMDSTPELRRDRGQPVTRRQPGTSVSTTMRGT